MWSILPLRNGMVAALLALPLCACQTLPRVAAPEPLAPPSTTVDAAILHRQWDPTIAQYASGGVWAWPNYVTFYPKPINTANNGYFETGLFLLNVVYSPYPAWVTDPMWKMVLYQQLSMDPTYTAIPVLPPSTQPSSGG
jgi:hypothetical protein